MPLRPRGKNWYTDRRPDHICGLQPLTTPCDLFSFLIPSYEKVKTGVPESKKKKSTGADGLPNN